MKRRTRSDDIVRLLSLSLELFAVIGLAGSTIPITQLVQPSNQDSMSTFASVQTSQSRTLPQIVFTATNIEPVGYHSSDGGFQQLRQAISEESEGVLYEDYRLRRSRMLICIEIAKRLSAGPLAVTDLALLTRVNFSTAKICLEQMITASLVGVDSSREGRKYILTAKGKLFLESGSRTIGLFQPEDDTRLTETSIREPERRTFDTY
ncbi:MAG: hypothetical protein JRN59_05655 [Nitrososphaerota archaeon]|nr:hypothetical protein [Nitrososphaerota archaeon]